MSDGIKSAFSHDAEQWRELAVSLRLEGQLAEAVDAGRRALERDPGDAQAWSELAHALRRQGKLQEAHRAASRAIELEPQLTSAWFNLGAVLLAQGETARSIEANRKALELSPDFAEAWSNLGGALAAAGDKAGEIDAYRRALAVNPRLALVWSNLGNALQEAGQAGEAIAACRRALDLDPNLAAAWNNLGNALLHAGAHEEAIRACESALALVPRLAEGWSTLAGALHAAGRYEEALRAHWTAIEIRPDSAHLHFNLGVTLQHCGRSIEAIASFRRALDIDPDHADAHFDLSLALLLSGQLREGWEEYEWRWRRDNAEAKRYPLAMWDGDTSSPRRLLLWAEQGIGDQIIYGSMISDLVASPMSITLEVDPRLAPLYRRSFPGVRVLARTEPPAADPAAYDYQAPLASLGRWLRGSFESFPRHRGHLKPDPSRVEAFRNRPRADRMDPLVGISWKSANREFGSFKSTDLRDWRGILKVPSVRFIDLQYGDTADERNLAEHETGVRIEHPPGLDVFNDLDGFAALCAACDLVVTVSNVTAHVAGALGRPVWLLLPRGNGRLWYWFSDRPDSPWYPNVRIFDQAAPRSWRETLDAVARELAAFVESVSSER